MSWVHEDQEGWDKCCRDACATWLTSAMREWDGAEKVRVIGLQAGWDIGDMMEMLQAEHPDVLAIMLKSGGDKYLADAQYDYFMGKVRLS